MAERELPLFSIGAVARMLDLSAATIRTWETRYGLVKPQRSEGGQRLYSRDQVDQLRFIKDETASGRRPGEAHRLLSERIARGDSFAGTRMRVLLAESKFGAASVLRDLVGGDVLQAFDELGPSLVVIDADDESFDELSERLRATGAKVLPIEAKALLSP